MCSRRRRFWVKSRSMKYAIARPFMALGRPGTLLTAKETRMSPAKLAEAVDRGVFIEVEEGDPEQDTVVDLQVKAKQLNIRGRTKMDRDELVAAIAEAEANPSDA